MEKRISFSQFQQVKSAAKMCNPLQIKCDALRTQIEKLATEYKNIDKQIDALEAGIKSVIGCRVGDLVKKVIEPGIDANGKPKKTTKYVPTDIVSYDEKKKQYVITLPDNEPTESTETPVSETPVTEEPSSENTSSEDNDIPSDAPIFA